MRAASGHDTLEGAYAASSRDAFAVVDGARFDDLPRLLDDRKVFARSLFLEQVDPELKKAGPWLVDLRDAMERYERLSDVMSFEGAAVLWFVPLGEATLYRHLRTLTIARLPKWAADGGSEPSTSDRGDERKETVFFRHYDPRVLSIVMPCLEASQFSRVVGPAEEIAFSTREFGLQRIVADKAWDPATSGPLTLTSQQCLALIRRRRLGSTVRIANFLRESAAPVTDDMSDGRLSDAIERYDAQARHMGVRDEEAIGLWSFLQINSANDLSKEPDVIRFMQNRARGTSPDDRMKAFFADRTTASGSIT